jgi:hypothetical protein
VRELSGTAFGVVEPLLRFIGYTPHRGWLGYIAKEAERAAKAISAEL